MSMQISTWENHLLALAYEGLDSQDTDDSAGAKDCARLEKAYQSCEDLTQVHSRTFFLASGLLPEGKRRAIRALYAFCRISDDLVDRAAGDAQAGLERWRGQTGADRSQAEPPCSDPEAAETCDGHALVALAWEDTRKKYRVPGRYAEQLLNGVASDLTPQIYPTFRELTTYCYGVACTVGLMSMHIIGYAGAHAIPYALRLGVALQMTNILRDVGEDWRNGRVYLPQDELEAFGLSTADIAAGRTNPRWREFMRFQIERTRQLYAAALPGVGLLDPSGRFAIGAAAEIYAAILKEIEALDYDVFNRRAMVSKGKKLLRLPGIWWRANFSGYRPAGDGRADAWVEQTSIPSGG